MGGRKGKCVRKSEVPEFRIDLKKVWESVENASPETKALAERAVRHLEAEKKRRAKMTPKQLRAADEAWAKRLSEDLARFTD